MDKIIFCLLCYVSFTMAVKWPRGTYTLVKPKSGCPKHFHEGWREQDTEDFNNKNRLTAGHHFFGHFDDSTLKFHYCTKDPNHFHGEGNWPSGNYCILKHYTCPPGFRTGMVRWDDEDYVNGNGYGGTLPNGYFGADTRIYYCCRNDEYYWKAIVLPTDTPFYLMRFTSQCQKVRGMNVREEHVHFDDEDYNNRNSVYGSYPFGAGGEDHDLYYCYYAPRY
ncbi:uncharacterized protein LOC134250940 [Saccostrea cucullata]|uniref:uncharacterized protein LOC134250940 n=1 Tax=Saccostrea cuccullata TaxID=36930 RepID=UPI002ED097E4